MSIAETLTTRRTEAERRVELMEGSDFRVIRALALVLRQHVTDLEESPAGPLFGRFNTSDSENRWFIVVSGAVLGKRLELMYGDGPSEIIPYLRADGKGYRASSDYIFIGIAQDNGDSYEVIRRGYSSPYISDGPSNLTSDWGRVFL